jgi:hypothetical protein
LVNPLLLAPRRPTITRTPEAKDSEAAERRCRRGLARDDGQEGAMMKRRARSGREIRIVMMNGEMCMAEGEKRDLKSWS